MRKGNLLRPKRSTLWQRLPGNKFSNGMAGPRVGWVPGLRLEYVQYNPVICVILVLCPFKEIFREINVFMNKSYAYSSRSNTHTCMIIYFLKKCLPVWLYLMLYSYQFLEIVTPYLYPTVFSGKYHLFSS